MHALGHTHWQAPHPVHRVVATTHRAPTCVMASIGQDRRH